MSVQDAETDLANFEARAQTLEAELAELRSEIAKIKNYLELSPRYAARSAVTHESPGRLNGSGHTPTHEGSVPSQEDEPLIEACRNKSIADAAIALIQLAGRPLSEEEIVDQFRRARVTTVSKNPALNLRFSLMRKRKETGAVKLTDDKRHWDLGDDPYPEDEASKRSAFFQNRKRNDHAERSRQGLLAARERGAKHGRQSKITPEMKEVAESLLGQGERFGEIAKLIGVSPVTFTRWRQRGFVKDPRSLNPDTTSSE